MIFNTVAALFVVGLLAWRATTLATSSSKDEALIRQHYQRQGWQVLEVRQAGADLMTFGARREPIRKYEVVIEDGDDRREFRGIGVQSVLFGEPRLVRYDDSGRRRSIF